MIDVEIDSYEFGGFAGAKSELPSRSRFVVRYLMPGFIVGIPAIPWIMPFLLGVLCLGSAAHRRREAVVHAARA